MRDDGTAEHYLLIEPPKRWAVINFGEVVEFRDLLMSFMRRDLKLRYRQTALGVIWVVLQPLLTAGAFSFIFGKVAKFPSDGVPYFVFAFAGSLGWSVFSNALGKISSSLVGNAQLVSKIFFPRLVLPLSLLGSVMVDLVAGLALLAVLCVIAGVSPGIGVLTLPFWIMLLLLMSCGLGLAAASLMVKYRDVGYVLPVIIQVLLYASPVAYSVAALPTGLRGWYQLNPLSGALEGFRWAVLGTHVPGPWPVLWSAMFAVVLFIAGASVFGTMERRFADVI
jgi:lipopolysaccharide transport system permease protein